MGSAKFKSFVESDEWMGLSCLDHIIRKHMLPDDALWARAVEGKVAAATGWRLRDVRAAIRKCVVDNYEVVEKYCYSFSKEAVDIPELVIETGVVIRLKDGTRRHVGGGYLRSDARRGERRWVDASKVRVVLRRVEGAGSPRFLVVTAFPAIC